jgi:hypothetical protein
MMHAIRLHNEIDSKTKVVPLMKGFTEEELEICYSGLEYFDHDYVAYYAAQLYTSGGREHKEQNMIDRIHHIADNTDANIILLGLLNETLRDLPSNVVAAAGNRQWEKRIDFDSASDRTIRDEWERLLFEVSDWLFE